MKPFHQWKSEIVALDGGFLHVREWYYARYGAYCNKERAVMSKEKDLPALSPGQHLRQTTAMLKKKAQRELYGKIIHQDSRVTVRMKIVGDEVNLKVHTNQVSAVDGSVVETLPIAYMIGMNCLIYEIRTPRPERV